MIQTLFAHQHVGDREQPLGIRRSISKPLLSVSNPSALIVDARFVLLIGEQNALDEIAANTRREFAEFAGELSVCLSMLTRKPRPNSALSSKSELHQAGPRPSLFCMA